MSSPTMDKDRLDIRHDNKIEDEKSLDTHSEDSTFKGMLYSAVNLIIRWKCLKPDIPRDNAAGAENGQVSSRGGSLILTYIS